MHHGPYVRVGCGCLGCLIHLLPLLAALAAVCWAVTL